MKDYELSKKERIISELMEEKMGLEQQLAFVPVKTDDELEVERLRSQVESLKLEKEELLKASGGGTKTDSYQMIKDLSDQNAKLRMKLMMANSNS